MSGKVRTFAAELTSCIINKKSKVMAIFFNKVQRVNPRNPKGDRKWYPKVKET